LRRHLQRKLLEHAHRLRHVPVAENQRQIEGAEAPVRHDFNKAAVVHVNGKDRETLSFRQGSGGKWRIARYSFSTTNPLPGG
jgi:hypothetical protein